jgi:conjugative relaxase-like TrwC/TraI family protein
VLNIGKLRPGGEAYYLNSVAKGVEDYYLGPGEAPGYWLASGAQDLGLLGEVTEAALRNTLGGTHPVSGEELVPPRRGERVPGFDLTFRAPKSVALLQALGPKEASNEVVNAHDAAVAASVDYLERVASGARRGNGGRTSIESEGFVGAAFRHRTSRAGDPLLHTHVLVANLIKGSDGRWGAVDARHLYLHAKTAGCLYQSHLRAELTRRLGVEWGPVRNGAADLQGVPRPVIRAFSRRRHEIEQASGGPDAAGGRRGQVAALVTRTAKDYDVSPEALLPEWRDRAQRLGLVHEDLEAIVDQATYRDLDAVEQDQVEVELASAKGLTAQSSTFSRREALQGYCAALPNGATVSDVEALVDRFLENDEVLVVGANESRRFRLSDSPIAAGTNETRYTTQEMLATERRVVEHAVARRVAGVGIVASSHRRAALASRPSLSLDQVEMVKRLTTSGAGVDVVVGWAGTGKTFALGGAREAWERDGHQVIGCALAARAAQELQSESGIPSTTLARLLGDLDDPHTSGLGRRTVVVVDEAGMVGTRDLERLLDHAARDCAKVVLVGDDAQLPEIAAGGAFRGIKERLGGVQLSEVRRQPVEWERDALELLRDGRAAEAVDTYTQHGRLFAARSPEKTRERLVADWWASYRQGGAAVMIAARRSDVAALNEGARELMAAEGRLDGDSIEVAGGSFARGDAVMTTRNHRQLGIVNGTRGTVAAVDPQSGEVTVETDHDRRITLPNEYLEGGHLTHAYAITGHKSQGMTTDKAFVLGDETLYKEWGYVAMSRGRLENRLYVVAGVDLDREDTGGEVARPVDPVMVVTRSLGRSRAKELALDAAIAEEQTVSADVGLVEVGSGAAQEPTVADEFDGGLEL